MARTETSYLEADMFTSVALTFLSLGVAVGAVAGGVAHAPSAAPARSAPTVAAAPARGTFAIALDDPTGVLVEPVQGGKCELTGASTLTFSGALAGSAHGTSSVLIFAPCSEATVNPPGTYFDLFSFEGTFSGTVHGAAATGTLSYSGVTRPGGDIDNALMKLRDGAWATLHADAGLDPERPGVFVGTYDGRAKH